MDTHTAEQFLADSVRRAARRFATGVTIVGVADEQGAHALTANSFVTFSLRPALVGVAVRTEGRTRHLVAQVRRFGISVLGERQAEYASHYATRGRDKGPVQLILSSAPTTPPVPIVPGCVAYFACELHDIHPVGDHDLLVGEVQACDALDVEMEPLIFLDGQLRGGRTAVI